MEQTIFNEARDRFNIPNEVDVTEYESIIEVFDQAVAEYGPRAAYSSFGKTLTFDEIDALSANFAAYLQNETNLQPGDRIALQLPNILQYPIAVYGAIRAGLVVVNTNPLYTATEMRHQFKDSGAKAIVVLANMASLVEEVLDDTEIEEVIVTQMGDVLPAVKRTLINFVVKNVKKMVPAYNLPTAKSFRSVLAKGAKHSFARVERTRDDIAVLQYTGGTTGVAKGAMLTHANLIANKCQVRPTYEMVSSPGSEETLIAPLPLYHIYAFTLHCMVAFSQGGHTHLIANPRDIPGFIKELKKTHFTIFAGLNTLFVGLMNNPGFKEVDWSNLKLTMSGGMALAEDTANRWEKLTGNKVTEGYGMTETSPVTSINPQGGQRLGTIGVPTPNTEFKIIDDEGNELEPGEGVSGELAVRGPQVMKGYWQREEATAEILDSEGWLKTGDIAEIDPDGFVRLVDRKKDMIIVSGFNVYPNELDNILMNHPDVTECAAVGIEDEKTGEAVKMFVVTSNPDLTDKDVISYMREHVTAYKAPRTVEFRDELPKTNVGKILRRELRDS